MPSTVVSHAVQPGLKTIPGVKNIIAIASGKGGVGKSTTAANLALALVAEGAKVGLLDADIYGPSQPLMLGINSKPEVSDDGKRMYPIERYGLQTMSIGYLVGDDQPVIWRGPMVSGALQQLLNETIWTDLDYLLIDLPPGTGDIHLTLVQKIPVSGAVVVTTPQDLALLDAGRACAMFQKVNVPVLGIIENMALHICSACGHSEAIFGEGGGSRLAEKTEVPLLGQLPLDLKIRVDADGGKPTVIAAPDSAIALQYRECAKKMAEQLALRPRNYNSIFPNIVVEPRK
jgi:ATP-binding protein involved in chromosome partitioning